MKDDASVSSAEKTTTTTLTNKHTHCSFFFISVRQPGEPRAELIHINQPFHIGEDTTHYSLATGKDTKRTLFLRVVGLR